MDNFFTSHGLMARLQQQGFCATGTVRDNRMEQSDALFDKANKIAAVRWNDNRVVSLLSNFEETKVYGKIQRRVKGDRKDVDVLFCITSYNKHKNGVDLFDSHMKNYFASIQGQKWYWSLFVNCFETALIAAWKISKLFSPDDTQDLLTFRRSITVSYLGETIPRNNVRQRGSLKNNKELLLLNSEHVLVKNPDGRQRRFQLKSCKKKPITICKMCDVGLGRDCFLDFHS
nr:piggyBac transposable element-derived protein 3-like [Parasteatoda tepidariorum]